MRLSNAERQRRWRNKRGAEISKLREENETLRASLRDGESQRNGDGRTQNLECLRLRKKITALQAELAAMRDASLDVSHVGSDSRIGIEEIA